MKTNNKIAVATLLLCGGLLVGGFGGLNNETVYAAEGTSVFEVKSVSLRIPDATYGKGMRFTIVMDKDTYTTEDVANLTTGLLVIPEYALGNEELTVDLQNATLMNVTNVSWTESADGTMMQIYLHLYGVPADQYTTDVCVRAYVDDGDEATEPIYTDVATSSVAKAADWLYDNDTTLDESEKATLKATYLTYGVFFHNGEDVTKSTGVYGEKIDAPIAPEKEGYAFGGWWNKNQTAEWDFASTTVSGATNLYAKWDIVTYAAKVVRANGNEETVEFTIENRAEKLAAIALTANDVQYTYSWESALPTELALNNDQVFTEQREVNKYVVKFVDENGTVLQSSAVEYGVMPAYNGEMPTRAADVQYTYTFDGWDSEVVSVTGAATYTAKYSTTTNKYLVKFVDEDGTELQASEVEYGTMPAYNGETPTKAADVQYTYTFDGWDSEVVSVTGAATYTAKYSTTTNKYLVKFVDEDGTELQASEVEYGTMPAYNGETPTKADDAQFVYVFKGWDKEIVAATENVTYTAVFEAISLTSEIFASVSDASNFATGAWIEFGATAGANAALSVYEGEVYGRTGTFLKFESGGASRSGFTTSGDSATYLEKLRTMKALGYTKVSVDICNGIGMPVPMILYGAPTNYKDKGMTLPSHEWTTYTYSIDELITWYSKNQIGMGSGQMPIFGLLNDPGSKSPIYFTDFRFVKEDTTFASASDASNFATGAWIEFGATAGANAALSVYEGEVYGRTGTFLKFESGGASRSGFTTSGDSATYLEKLRTMKALGYTKVSVDICNGIGMPVPMILYGAPTNYKDKGMTLPSHEWTTYTYSIDELITWYSKNQIGMGSGQMPLFGLVNDYSSKSPIYFTDFIFVK